MPHPTDADTGLLARSDRIMRPVEDGILSGSAILSLDDPLLPRIEIPYVVHAN